MLRACQTSGLCRCQPPHCCLCAQAADNLQYTWETVAAVADKHGLVASFLPLPFAGQSGSGCHCHLSLWQVRTSPSWDASCMASQPQSLWAELCLLLLHSMLRGSSRAISEDLSRLAHPDKTELDSGGSHCSLYMIIASAIALLQDTAERTDGLGPCQALRARLCAGSGCASIGKPGLDEILHHRLDCRAS